MSTKIFSHVGLFRDGRLITSAVSPFDTSKCYEIDVDESIEVPSNDIQFQTTSSFTYFARVKTTSTSFWGTTFAYTNGSTTGYMIRIFGATLLRFDMIGLNGYLVAWASMPTINNGLWHSIAVTYDGSDTYLGLKFYLDGVLVPQANGGGSSIGTVIYTGFTAPLIGALGGSAGFSRGLFYNGFMDDIVFANRAFTLAEIQSMSVYQDFSLSSLYPDFLRWYRCGEVDISTPSFICVDSKNGYNGTPSNMSFASDIVSV